MRKLKIFILTIFLIILFFAGMSPAADVTLQWDANGEPDIAGYKVYYGTESGNYTTTIDVGNLTSCVIPDLDSELTYYFAATAYNTDGYESDYSNEVTYCGTSSGDESDTPSLVLAVNIASTSKGVMNLEWEPVSAEGITGYKVYHGTQSGVYGDPIDVGNETKYTLTDLADGTHYATVVAYNSDGYVSSAANEVSHTFGPPSSVSLKVAQTIRVDVDGQTGNVTVTVTNQ